MRRSSPVTSLLTGACALAAGLPAAAQDAAQDTEIELLQRELDALQERLSLLESRPAMQLGEAPEAPPTRVRFWNNLNDRQTPAPRLDNLAVDPELKGFFPVFGDSLLLKFNAKPRVDAIWSDTYPGNKDRFVPAQFPVPGDADHGGGGEYDMNINGTQLTFEVRDPDNPNGFRFYYQNDFFGATNENNQYRLQHAYGQTHNVVVGWTFGVFEDPDIWPETVDYEGPNALIFARRALVHYKRRLSEEWQMTVGVEQPDIYLDTTADPDAGLSTRAPDLGFNFRWERPDSGHLQTSAIVRSIGAQGSGVEEQYELGWGANVSLGLQVDERNDLGLLFVGGEGVGGMGNDTSFLDSDAAIDADGDLVALPYYSGMVTFRHRWSDKLRSTATYGYVSLDTVDGQADDAYDGSQYASLNLIYAFARHGTVGIEGLYGQKSVRDGRDSEVFRLQIGLAYALF